MRLVTEEGPEIDNPSAADVQQTLADDAFGGFVILFRDDDAFIQAASVWEPGPETEQFLEEHDSDPFRLEVKDVASGRLYAVDSHVTLDAVTEAFLRYHQGDESWRSRYAWVEVELNDTEDDDA